MPWFALLASLSWIRWSQACHLQTMVPPLAPWGLTSDVERAAPASSPGWRRGALVAAALLLVAVAALLLAWRWSGDDDVTYHRLRVLVHATGDRREVLFHIELPPGVATLPSLGEALGRQRRLRWRSTLTRGHNALELPLVARGTGGVIRARLEAGGQVMIRTVSLASRGRAQGSPIDQHIRLAWDLRAVHRPRGNRSATATGSSTLWWEGTP